jgi:hypothetical protein
MLGDPGSLETTIENAPSAAAERFLLLRVGTAQRFAYDRHRGGDRAETRRWSRYPELIYLVGDSSLKQVCLQQIFSLRYP